MKKRLQKFMTAVAAITGSLVMSVSAFAANGADPEGVMPFAADSTGEGVSFVVNNGDENTSIYHELKVKTFTSDADLRFNGYTSTSYFTSSTYNDGTYVSKDGVSYPVGYDFQDEDTISTGHTKATIVAPTGYHTYGYEKKEGEVVIDYWTLKMYPAQCIHGDKLTTDHWNGVLEHHSDDRDTVGGKYSTDGHGYVISKCLAMFNNVTRGWCWHCSECGNTFYALHYMTPETASNFYALDASYYYYYVCPYNGNMEVTTDEIHECLDISPNKYTVTYNKNGGNGFMSKSTHLYDNGGKYGYYYNGKKISASTSLNINAYTRNGYVFKGWNTKADGSGTSYTDGQEILNLTTVDKDNITLYAQWEPKEDYLTVNADDGNGRVGTYDGKTSATYTVSYLNTYDVLESKATAPAGYQVVFDTNGGTISGMNATALANVNGTTGYSVVGVSPIEEWDYTKFLITNWNSKIDTDAGKTTVTNKNTGSPENPIITLNYYDKVFSLPYASKSGSIFIGWQLTTGSSSSTDVYPGGTSVMPNTGIVTNNVIKFVAVYGDLTASVVPDYQLTTNDGDGAVDIDWGWSASSSFPLYYKVYEGNANKTNLVQIDVGDGTASQTISTGVSNATGNATFTAPAAGTYTITVTGAKGASTSSYSGGNGRTVTVQLWLNEGDQIIYAKLAGGTSSSTAAGGSGGAGEIAYLKRKGSSTQTVIAIAGGGGAATDLKAGGAATSAVTSLNNGTHTGENGYFGGGAGNTPGAAGVAIYHVHDSSCYHVHSGSATSGGGCYEQSTTKETCTYEIYTVSEGTMHTCSNCGFTSHTTTCWWEGGHDCGNSPSSESAGEHVCNTCGSVSYSWGSASTGTYTHTYDKTIYVLGCDYKAYTSGQQVSGNLVCAYATGSLITSSTAATGGSSYYASSVKLVSDAASTSTSNSITITGKTVGVSAETSIANHAGDDTAAPKKMTTSDTGANDNTNVDLVKINYDTNDATISISKPDDNGTTYSYYVEGYQVSDSTTESPTLVTSAWAKPDTVTITTGVAGYKIGVYKASQNGLTCTNGTWSVTPVSSYSLALDITSRAGSSSSHPQSTPNETTDDEVMQMIPLQTYNQYVYVTAYDFAENYSEPCLLVIPGYGTIIDVPQAWPVYTDKLAIAATYPEYGNVYKDPNKMASVTGISQTFDLYYIKADGSTPFRLTENAYNSSQAMVDVFHVNTVSYSTLLTTNNVLTTNPAIEYQLITDGILTDSGTSSYTETAGENHPYSITPYLNSVGEAIYSRYLDSANGKKIVATDLNFTVDSQYSGTQLFIFPEATGLSVTDNTTVESNRTLDVANGLVVIPDGEGPTVTETTGTLNDPGTQTKWDPNDIPDKIIFDIEDLLSGVAPDEDDPTYPNIKVTIKNDDSGTIIEYPIEDLTQPGSTIITIPVDEDDPVFSGTFTIIIETVDNVGNETKVEYEVTNFTSDSYIEYVDMKPAAETVEKYFATLDNGNVHVILKGYVEEVVITAPDCITFTESGTNKITISYTGDSSADVIGNGYPIYETDTEIPFIVSGKLDSDQTLTFTVDATKDSETKTTYLYAPYKKDSLSIIENGIYSTEATAGIANVCRVPSTYSGLVSGMVTGDSGNSYFVKTDTNFTAKHIGSSTLPTREDATFDKMYMTVKNLTDNTADSTYYNGTSLESLILNKAPSYTYRYFKYNSALGNTISFDTTGKDILSSQNTERSITIANGQSFSVTNYIQRIASTLTWTAPDSVHGDVIRIVPRLTLAYEQGAKLTNIDTGNVTAEALYVIPDAIGPVIGGADDLDQTIVYPGTIKQVDFTFTDDVSGLHHTEIYISNISNGTGDYIETTDPNKTINIDPNQDLWLGVIEIKVITYDNVGNPTEATYIVYSLNIDGTITNTHEPYTNVFYSGNRGWLFIETIGYADSIDVIFPADLHPTYWVYQDGDTYGQFEYEKDASGNYVLDDDGDLIPIKNYSSLNADGNPTLPQIFTIPLDEGIGYDHSSPKRVEVVEFYVEDKEDLDEVYTVTVVAHKGDATVSDDPFLVIMGYSSDLWRTRLR